MDTIELYLGPINGTVNVKLIRKRIKNVHLKVFRTLDVVLSVPDQVPDEWIDSFLSSRQKWIDDQITKYKRTSGFNNLAEIRNGSSTQFLGKDMRIYKEASLNNRVEVDEKKVHLYVTDVDDEDLVQRVFSKWWRQTAETVYQREVDQYYNSVIRKYGIEKPDISIRKMKTLWGSCTPKKSKITLNEYLLKANIRCVQYVVLHELTHLLTRKHDATFIAHMDRHMPNWREVRKELNDSRLDYYEAQDESPLQKLIDQSRYDDIRDAAIAYIQEDHSGDTKRLSVIDMEIENVIHIEQPEDGVIAFDVIASCDVEMPSASRKGYFNERWLKIHCQATLGIDMSGFRIMSVGNCEPQEESDNDRLSGELVPIISRDQFEYEAEKFLTRYCQEALDKPMRVPIETIASDMKLQVIEDVPLSDDLTYFGTIIFDNGNVLDKHRKITIRNAKRGTVYLDPRVSYERSVGTKRTTLAHECFHWHRHQPYHVLMKMIGADDNLGKAIQCQIAANFMDSDKWKAVDWMEWQAKGVAPRILMPAKPTRVKADQLLAVYGGADNASIAAYENVIDELAELFDVSRQAAKVRLMDLGYSKVEGAYPFVDGQYVHGYSFEAGALDKNQTFTISYADLFKAYCFDREFKKLIDSGQFVFADRHLVLNNEKYISRDQSGNATLSEYALSHMDECCVIFSKGYSYQSKYQGARYYTQFMRNAAPVENQVEYSFELNAHNKTLLEQIKNAKRRSEAMRRYPGSFAETLVALQKERKLSKKQLAVRSLVGEKNIQRLRNDEEYPTSVQTVLALCVGLKLPLPEAEMFLGKTDFKLNSMKNEGYVYQCVLAACAENSIYEINEMLKENGITPLGSDPDLQ